MFTVFSYVVIYQANANGNENFKKFPLSQMEEQEKDTGMSNIIENEQCETSIRGSEEMESNITRLLEKIESFTQLVGGGYAQSLWAENMSLADRN